MLLQNGHQRGPMGAGGSNPPGVQKTSIVWLLVLVVSAGLYAVRSTAEAQQAASQPLIVSDIQITGNKAVDEALIRQKITRTKIGQSLDIGGIRGDVDAIKLLGKFRDVQASPQVRQGKLVVVFEVIERPLIVSVIVVGAKKFKAEELERLLGFAQGDFLDSYKVQLGARAIEQHYHEAGYAEVTVETDSQALEQRRIVYHITEGSLVRIRKITFEGNQAYSNRRLLGQITSRKYIWIVRKGNYSQEQIAQDIVSLHNFYRSQGFLDAKVDRQLIFSDDRTRLAVIFLVDEGIRYAIDKISIQGNEHFDTDQILSAITRSQVGRFLIAEKVRNDRKAIAQLYHNEGFIYATVTISHSFTEQPGLVVLNVQINQGQPYNIGRIIVRGNTRTQDRVVRRVVDFYPGQIFNLEKMDEARLRLRETRLFSDVSIESTGTDPKLRDVLIQVEETDTTFIMASVGVTSNSGMLGSLSIENWNFDLFDWPRNAREFFTGQAFKGAGQTLKLSLEPGTELSRFRIDFREPYLMDLPISLGVSAYLFDRDRDGYTERRVGTLLSLGKRFKKIYAAEAAIRFEGVQVSDITRYFWLFAPDDIDDVEGWNLLTSLKLSLVRDTTDSFFAPSRGTRLVGSWEQAGVFGGDFTFSKFIGQGTYYKTLRTDEFDRKTVWASNVEIGYISGDVPVFERFYAGGIGSIRGFDFRGISPRQWPGDTRVGGDFELLVGNQVSFPLVGETLRGVAFLDMGTVEEDFGISNWRASVGFGLRLKVDFFGPIPMAFDLAWPISKDSQDDTQVFSFSLGTSFR